jgi:hypothetical protein
MVLCDLSQRYFAAKVAGLVINIVENEKALF